MNDLILKIMQSPAIRAPHNPNNIVCKPGYRLLFGDEIIEKGDELSALGHDWYPAEAAAGKKAAQCKYVAVRRKLPIEAASQPMSLGDEVNAVVAERDALRKKHDQLQKELQAEKSYSTYLGDRLYYSNREATQLKEQIARMQKNASGNAVLVRRDGFSKPIQFEPTLQRLRMAEYHAPAAFTSSYATDFRMSPSVETVDFTYTGKTDGFGRRIFQEAA